MLGAIVGDIVGSRYEFNPIKTTEFDLMPPEAFWTDDTVMTLAVADALVHCKDMASTLRRWGKEYPTSYGLHFWDWIRDPHKGPYGSWGNGASMRVSPAAWLAHDVQECLEFAKQSAEVTHNHPEGIRGAQATALAIYAARTGWTAAQIRDLVSQLFGYDLFAPVDEIRPGYVFEVKSWKSVPQAIICALNATSFDEAIRLAVSLGGDADTQAAIAGSIAEPLFGIPNDLAKQATSRLIEPMATALNEARTHAAGIRQRPIRDADKTSIPRWDPRANDRWEAELKARRPNEDPPGYRDEMDKVLGLLCPSAPHLEQPKKQRGWFRRVLGI
ncbi:ADP-ribosyl-[dinitrogen reductase] hydrolase [Bradyrhizobium sp. USDA 4341]